LKRSTFFIETSDALINLFAAQVLDAGDGATPGPVTTIVEMPLAWRSRIHLLLRHSVTSCRRPRHRRGPEGARNQVVGGYRHENNAHPQILGFQFLVQVVFEQVECIDGRRAGPLSTKKVVFE
jgi:hypothetical protein